MKTNVLLSTLFACFLLITNINAQTPTFDWAFNLGTNGNLYTRSMVLDDHGNIYTIGSFNWGPIDFDPGTDSLNLTSAGSIDIYVSKFNASGGFIWAKKFGGTESDDGLSIAVDDSGNVYFTGDFAGEADFDPGTDVYNLTSGGGSDIFVCKLDPNGNLIWAKQIGSTSSDNGAGIITDAAGNVYVTGSFQQTVDFDLGAETGKLTSNGRGDIFICKFNTLGTFQWVKQIGSTGQDYGQALVLDDASNLFLTGYFADTVDFNPGAGVFNLVASTNGYDGFVLKLNASGDFVWATKLADGLSGNAITLDAPGNIYIGGGGPGIGVVKLSAKGNITWSKLLAGSNSNAYSITVDPSGNVYTTGAFRNDVDFDPGAGSVIFDSGSGWDSYINKFDASGDYVWAYQIGEPQFHDHGTAIALDASGNIYSYGHFRNTIDFDPGPNTFNLNAYSYDSFLLKWKQPTVVGISENTFTGKIRIYPNPTSGNFAIKFETVQKDLSVRIMSISGQIVESRTFQNTDFVELKLEQPNGFYLVEIRNENDNKTGFRLIKK
ncbi:hypothetical protein MASR2M47_33640 [Draconibacterium sp.]